MRRQKLQIFYREIRREECAGQVFEKAWLADQAVYHLAESAYGLYMRGADFAAAQKVAVKLQRALPQKAQRYALWIAAASWLELHFNNPVCAGTATVLDERMLKLASMRVQKALEDTSIPTSEEVRFAVRLYLDAGKFDTAKNLLGRPRIVMDAAEVLRFEAIVAERAERREEAKIIYQKLLTQYDADDWNHWVQYFKCCGDAETGRTEAWALVDAMCAREKSVRHAKRGPFLARMELFLRECVWDSLQEAVVEYFAMFSKKLVCAHDVRPYISYLVQEQREAGLFEQLTSSAENGDAISQVTLSWLLLWFNRLGESAEALFDRYFKLVDDKIDSNERQVGDDFLLLAVHKLLPLVPGQSRYRNAPVVFQAIAILETGLSRSPENYHFKLLLIVLYMEIKYTERAFAIWSSLGVKHIQLATLTHLVLSPLFAAANQNDIKDLLSSVSSLWKECDKDIPDGISRAFQAGSINAATEFLFFRRRVERSAILAEAMHLEALAVLGESQYEPSAVEKAWNVIGEAPRFSANAAGLKQGLVDNHDTKCLDFWELDHYDPNARLKGEDDPSVEFGVALSPEKQMALFSGIKATHAIVAMAHDVHPAGSASGGSPGEHIFQADISLLSNGNLSNTSREWSCLGQSTARRAEFLETFSRNLCAMRKCLLEKGNVAEQDSDPKIPANELQDEAKSLSTFLLEDCTRMHTRFEKCWKSSENSPVMPLIIEECGYFVSQVLLLVCIGVVSTMPLVTQKKRHGRKGGRGAGGNQAKHASDVKNIEMALAEYKKIGMSCCEHIAVILAGAIQNCKWENAVCSGIDEAGSLISFLPDSVKLCSFAGEKPAQNVVRKDLAGLLLRWVGRSHTATVERLSRRVTEIESRLRLSGARGI